MLLPLSQALNLLRPTALFLFSSSSDLNTTTLLVYLSSLLRFNLLLLLLLTLSPSVVETLAA